jgi:uncharacterized protein
MQLNKKHIEKIERLCQSHSVNDLFIFGSAAKNQLTGESDIDFLVSFLPKIDLLDYADNYFSLLEALEQIMERKVDLVSSKSLKNPILIEEINKTKISIYESQKLQVLV